jgi:hypothetical protein
MNRKARNRNPGISPDWEGNKMIKRLLISAALLLATWSLATASYAALSINLPGLSMNLPLPGARVSIGLPVVPVYHRVETYEPPVCVRAESHVRYDERRPYYRHVPRDNDHGYGRHGNDGYRDNYRYR